MTQLEQRPDITFSLSGDSLHTLRRGVRAVAPHVSDDEFRPILTGILIESDGNGGVKVCALDSYTLAQASLNVYGLPEFKALIPAVWLTKVMPGRKPHMSATFEMTLDDEGVTWIDLDESEASGKKLLNADLYPDVDQLLIDNAMPKKDTKGERAFNPQYFARVMKSATVFDDGDQTPVRVGQIDFLKPCRFESVSGDDRLVQLLMPVLIPERGK